MKVILAITFAGLLAGSQELGRAAHSRVGDGMLTEAVTTQEVGGPAQSEARAALLRGVELLNSKRLEEAITELQTAVNLAPDDWEARYQLGRTLFIAGRPEAAASNLVIALETTTNPAGVHYLLAQVWLRLEEYEAVAVSLDAVEKTAPDHAPAGYFRAELCYRLGHRGEARRRFEETAARTPRWEMPRIRAASLAQADGDFDDAVKWFRAALQVKPDDPLLWTRLGNALGGADRPSEAADAYRRALEIAPDLIVARMSLVAQLDSLLDYEGLLASVGDILERQPDNVLALYQQSLILNREGHTEEALAGIDRALTAVLREREQYEKVGAAETVFDDAGLTLVRRGARTLERMTRSFRSRILTQLNRDEEAVQEARKVIDADPWHPEPYFVLGNALIRLGDAEEGRRQLSRFKDFSDAREHRIRGDDQRRRVGDFTRAISEYEAALEIVPDQPFALVGLATVKRTLGLPEEALELVQRGAPPAQAVGLEWFREAVLALHGVGEVDEARKLWLQARSRGFVLGPEVWRVMRTGIAGC